MLQSCETLITKINEWQKAVLELEKLSEEFLDSGDTKLKPKIDTIRQEVKKLIEEYRKLAYPELPNGEKLFWPEKEVLTELFQALRKNLEDSFEIYNTHITRMSLMKKNLFKFSSINLSLFQYLKVLYAPSCNIKISPFLLPESIEEIFLDGNLDITREEKQRIKKEYPNAVVVF